MVWPESKYPKGKFTILISVGILILLMIGTWIVAGQFQSSAQRAAAALPPAPQPVLVPIEKTDLVERTTMKARALRSGERQFVLPKSGATSVITAQGIRKGQELQSGAVITWINDRPLIALSGTFPLYRDLREGDSGEDVRMIQTALRGLGYNIAPDGQFGPWTASCIRDLYSARGAKAPEREKKAEVSPADPPLDGLQSGSTMTRTSAPAKAEMEIYLPASEILVIPDLPAHVNAVPALGTILGDDNSALVLASSKIAISAEVPGPVAARLTQGRQGTAAVGQQEIKVSISAISEKKKAERADEIGSSGASIIEFTTENGSIPFDWVGHEDILIAINFTDPLEGVLAVPQRAIAVDAAGQSHILLQRGDAFIQVPIRQVGCVTGMCAIESTQASMPLREGFNVRVDR